MRGILRSAHTADTNRIHHRKKFIISCRVPCCGTNISSERYLALAEKKKEQFLKGMRKSLDEAQRLAKFTQIPEIAQIYDFFVENNTAYIVMELLEGEILKARLKCVGKMSVEEALLIVLAVLDALKAAHAQNVIHRDISPDNK